MRKSSNKMENIGVGVAQCYDSCSSIGGPSFVNQHCLMVYRPKVANIVITIVTSGSNPTSAKPNLE